MELVEAGGDVVLAFVPGPVVGGEEGLVVAVESVQEATDHKIAARVRFPECCDICFLHVSRFHWYRAVCVR